MTQQHRLPTSKYVYIYFYLWTKFYTNVHLFPEKKYFWHLSAFTPYPYPLLKHDFWLLCTAPQLIKSKPNVAQ